MQMGKKKKGTKVKKSGDLARIGAGTVKKYKKGGKKSKKREKK